MIIKPNFYRLLHEALLRLVFGSLGDFFSFNERYKIYNYKSEGKCIDYTKVPYFVQQKQWMYLSYSQRLEITFFSMLRVFRGQKIAESYTMSIRVFVSLVHFSRPVFHDHLQNFSQLKNCKWYEWRFVASNIILHLSLS